MTTSELSGHPSPAEDSQLGPEEIKKPKSWTLVVAACLALALALGLYIGGVETVEEHKTAAKVLLVILNLMWGASAALACLTVMLTYTEGKAAKAFAAVFRGVAVKNDGLAAKFNAVPFLVMTGALFGFGSSIVEAVGGNWSDQVNIAEWPWWLGGLFATLVIAALIAHHLEQRDAAASNPAGL